MTLVDNSQSGNAARNSVVGPGFNTTDMSLFKSLNFSERYVFQFRFEAFNVFNEAHFSQPVATFSPATNTDLRPDHEHGRQRFARSPDGDQAVVLNGEMSNIRRRRDLPADP